MKFIASGFAALVLSSAAGAQTPAAQLSVPQAPYTFYGAVDLGVEMTSGPETVNRMGFGSASSKWGVKGSRDLGGDLRGTYQLEGGFSADDGTLSNASRLFGRYATVGLAGSWGEVKFGRQLTMLIPAMMDSDIFGPSWYGMGSLDSYLPNARADNAIGYLGSFGGIDMGATFSLGRDVGNNNKPSGTNCPGEVADSTACREASFMIRYRSKGWGLAYGVDELSGGAGAFGGLTSSNLKDRRTTLGGYVMLGENFKLAGGFLHRDNDGKMTDRTSNVYYVGGKYKLTESTSLDAQVLQLKYEQSSKSADYYIARVTKKLSKDTSIYALASQIRNSANSSVTVSPGLPGVPGMQQTGVILGVAHEF